MKRIPIILLMFISIMKLNAINNPISPDVNARMIDKRISGSVTIYDLKNNKWIFSDEKDANKKTIPASTFKILNSLIALEEKVITPNDILKWDGQDKKFKGNTVKSWNADSNLESAFKNSTIWFYTDISKQINRSTYKKYLKTISYGNLNLSMKGDDFWNYGKMEISPRNQVEFITKLYMNELPFQVENMNLIKSFMKIRKDETYSFYGKSGWAVKNGNDIGWIVGFLETDNNAYIYATRIIAKSNKLPYEFGKYRADITLETFKKLKIIN